MEKRKQGVFNFFFCKNGGINLSPAAWIPPEDLSIITYLMLPAIINPPDRGLEKVSELVQRLWRIVEEVV